MATTSAYFNVITDSATGQGISQEIELGPITHVRWMQGSQAFNLVSPNGKEYLVHEDVASIAAKFQAAGIDIHVFEDAVKDGAPLIVPAQQIVRQKWDGHFTTVTVGIAPPHNLLARKNPLNLEIEP